MTTHEMLELVPLYALDALGGEEERRFRDHVGTCPECQAALDECREAAARLVPDGPAPEADWDRIREAMAPGDPTDDTAEVVPVQPSPGDGPWRVVAAVAASLALVFGTMLVSTVLANDPGADVVDAAQRAAEEPDSVVGDFIVEDAPVARIVVSANGNGFVIPADELPALDPGHTYQLWVVNEEEDAISAGVLGNDPQPATFTWTGPISGFALTREVAGGVVSSAGDVVSVIADV